MRIMTEVVNLNEVRAVTKGDSSLWSPRDCLEAVLRDIKNGEIKPDSLMVLYSEKGGLPKFYRCHMTYEKNITMLRLAEQTVIQEMLDG